MWHLIKSTDDDKKLKDYAVKIGGFQKLILEIKNEIGIKNDSFKSWKGLCTFLVQFNTKYRKCDDVIIKHEDPYFRSEASRYIFALVELDTEKRAELLGITRALYSDAKLAKKWYRDISKIIHPDVCNEAHADQAMAKLGQLYRRMIKDGE